MDKIVIINTKVRAKKMNRSQKLSMSDEEEKIVTLSLL
jgi:hypothetical protein